MSKLSEISGEGLINYLLHFPVPSNGVQHYLGTTLEDRFERRMQEHASGVGSSVTKHLLTLNSGFYVTRIWKPGSYKLEQKLKTQGHFSRKCPICSWKEGSHTILGISAHPVLARVKIEEIELSQMCFEIQGSKGKPAS